MAELVALIGIYSILTAVGGSMGIRKIMRKRRKKKEEKKRLKEQEDKLEKEMNKYIKRTKEIKPTSKKVEEICVICQDDFKEDNECSKLYCDHKFHKNCIKQWICHKKTCPLCNLKLKKRKRKKNIVKE